jgi:hypothetical protein
MTAIIRTVFVAALGVLLASCGIKESTERASTEIGLFHANLDKQDYDAIWKTTSGEFRKITSKEDFQKLLAAIHTEYGVVKKADQQAWQTNNDNGVSTVTIKVQTTFEKGEAPENFIYVWEGEQLKLMGYNINSE